MKIRNCCNMITTYRIHTLFNECPGNVLKIEDVLRMFLGSLCYVETLMLLCQKSFRRILIFQNLI